MKKSDFSFVANSSPAVLEDLYNKYLEDPESIDSSWSDFFKGFDFAMSQSSQLGDSPAIDADAPCSVVEREFRVADLIHGYRQRGHLFCATNPVRRRREYFPKLVPETFGLNQDDLEEDFEIGKSIGVGKSKLKTIINHLEETYCGSVGVEYLYMRNPEVVEWLKKRMEASKNRREFSLDEKRSIYKLLNKSTHFEQFIHSRFTGQKRFSLEGAEVLIPGLHALISKGSELGVKEFAVAMAHRGRLNVLTNVLQKPYKDIFREYEGEDYVDSTNLGDVKYHLGYGRDTQNSNGGDIRINLLPNPSHLEAVLPVLEGLCRAKIDHQHDQDRNKLVPIAIHGDAAIAAQGVIYETIQMAGLDGYRTGGTVHVVVNNQVGFTTSYLEARTSTYCTDIAKVTRSPVFHVNGDDVEAVAYAMEMAIEFRQRYHSDVFVDILCYRKYGHNEGDEPRFTQPLLYKMIASHPNPLAIYTEKLINEGSLKAEELNLISKEFEALLEEELEEARKTKTLSIRKFLPQTWKDYRSSTKKDFAQEPETGINPEDARRILAELHELPKKDRKFFKKVDRIVNERLKQIEKGEIDWGLGELLAYGSLLEEGHPVRLSGQDTVRGTFAHRHAEFVEEDKRSRYSVLEHLPKRKALVGVYNSLLSEYGVLGFEYGYALGVPNGLNIWEAQYGDFHNVAQVIVDQYISSAEEKWGLANGLVLLLPHSYEGQGPEHSSGRIERFLQITAELNMQVCNCTTPANFFHLLRRQVHRPFRTPLVVFSPKSLLRHPLCRSKLSDFTDKTFQPLIDENNPPATKTKRLVFCSGKIYYDILKRREDDKIDDLAIIRMEQLYPFPEELLEKVMRKYKKAETYVWAQEEPMNMGAYDHFAKEWNKHPKYGNLHPVVRLPAGSPSTGLKAVHDRGQEELLQKIFRKCSCGNKLTYCKLDCDKLKKEIKSDKVLSKYTYDETSKG